VVQEYLAAMKDAVAYSADKANAATVAPLISKHASVSADDATYAFDYFQPLWQQDLSVSDANWGASCDEAKQTTTPKAGVEADAALDLAFLPK
jgi:hypothetical protein